MGMHGWAYMWPLVNLLLLLLFFGAGIYGFVLLMRFLRLGIEAFSIYIEKNKSEGSA